MATNTYVAIDTKTISVGATSIEFTAIPQGYTDLVLSVKASTVSDGEGISFQVGNATIDTSANYSRTLMSGANDTNAAGAKSSNQSSVSMQYATGLGSDQTSAYQVHFMNYANTSIYKTFYINASTNRGTSTNKKETMRAMALWRSFSAINRIKVTTTVNMNVGSTFTLYGIAADTAITSTAKATGGTISFGVEHTYHTFTSSGTFTPTEALTNVDYLVVAGGGGGSDGAPGGAGGLRSTVTATGGGGSLESPLSLASGTGYTVTIGAGGPNGTTTANGTKGENSTFATITSAGGGAGKEFSSTATSNQNGGSGAGGINSPNTNLYSDGGTGTANQGFAGGQAFRTSGGFNAAGGGGGAGGAGVTGSGDGSNPIGGNGGPGLTIAMPGSTGTYAGGGGGGAEQGGSPVAGAGGIGGGGAGSTAGPGGSSGTSATSNTGGGGGGGGTNNTSGGSGGSGIVIIRYAN
jgi:hypothetical protein